MARYIESVISGTEVKINRSLDFKGSGSMTVDLVSGVSTLFFVIPMQSYL